jgi:predicted dehydrogenase
MVRLALIGTGDCVDRVQALMPRIEGAQVTVVTSSAGEVVTDHVTQCDAAILLGNATPSDCEMLVTAGKHLLVPLDSPMDSKAIQGLLAQCSEQGICLMVAGTDRLEPSLEATQQSLVAGELGDPGLVRIHRWSTTGDLPLAASGMSRDLDLVLNVFQSLPQEVYAVARSVLGDSERDYLQVHLGFHGGGMAVIDRSGTLPPGDGYFSFSVIGSAGAAYADDHLNKQLVYRGEHPSAIGTGSEDLGWVGQLQEFCDAIRQQRDPVVTGSDWLAVARVSEAVRHSIGSGEVVTMSTGGTDDC